MSSENVDDLEKKVSIEDLEIETDEKTKAEDEPKNKVEPKNSVEVIKAVKIVAAKTKNEIQNDSNKNGSSNTDSNSSRNNKTKSATLNREYDRRLNPDAPVFVPRSSTYSQASCSLVQKNFPGGDEEKNSSCGAVYDSIWSENSVTPTMPPVQSLVSRPKLPSSHMMMSSPMSRHFHACGATNSATGPGFRGYLTSQGFYELRRTQSNVLSLQPLNLYASGNAPQSVNYSNLNGENKLSPAMPIKSMPNVSVMSNNPADGIKVQGVDSIEGNNNDTKGSKVQELEEPKEKSPIKSKMRGILVQKSRDDNYDPCDIKYGRGCCCSLM